VRKIRFRENQQLQVFDFIEANFAILIVFEFILMTAEIAEIRYLKTNVRETLCL